MKNYWRLLMAWTNKDIKQYIKSEVNMKTKEILVNYIDTKQQIKINIK